MNIYPDSIGFAEFADSLALANPPEPVVEQPGYMSGVLPDNILLMAGDNSIVIGILVLITILLMLFTRGVRRTLKSYRGELWSLRRRPNVFDTEIGVSVPVAFVLALTFIVFTATDLYIGLNQARPLVLTDYFSMLALIAGYYLFKIVAYAMVGYAFAVPPGGRQWLMGFNAAMAYTGLALIIPTFVALYVPAVAQWIVPYCIIAWLIGQIIFICKGFRIFYHDFGSIFYFFLYLCTLEIIPLFALGSAIYLILDLPAPF